MKKVQLYADGSSDREGFGGFAWVLTDGPTMQDNIIADENQGRENTTNNRMELQGIISGLRCCLALYLPDIRCARPEGTHTQIEVYSDSAYVVNCFLQKWYRKWIENGWVGSEGPIKNLDMWKELLYLVNDMTGDGFEIVWIHVHGHRSNVWNNRCDQLAGGARKHKRAEKAGGLF